MRVFDELEIELVEVGGYVHALELVIVILIHQDVVRVNLKSSVFAQNYTNLILFLRFIVRLGDLAVLE